MNKFTDFTLSFNVDEHKQMVEQLEKLSVTCNKIYSYIAYCKFDGKPIKWKIKFMIADNDKFNTLNTAECKDTILNNIKETLTQTFDKCTKIICYKQASLEVLIEVFNPLIKMLVYNKCTEWKNLEYDDALQLCYLALIKLYNQDYYIHKTILAKAFNNEVLMYLRKYNTDYTIVSLDNLLSLKQNEDEVCLLDTLVDEYSQEMFDANERVEIVNGLFDKIKSIIIDLTSERQFDELFREYTTKTVSNSNAKKMLKIKNTLVKRHISIETLLEDLL